MALVQARLAKRLRALGMTDFAPYCALIEGRSDEALAERQELITAITTNVTRFFREPHHFDMLRTRVLPPLIEHARKGGRVRLWSAGCSTGEEPYSIALTLLDMASDAGRHDIKILATDLDRAAAPALAHAIREVLDRRAHRAEPGGLVDPRPLRRDGDLAEVGVDRGGAQAVVDGHHVAEARAPGLAGEVGGEPGAGRVHGRAGGGDRGSRRYPGGRPRGE